MRYGSSTGAATSRSTPTLAGGGVAGGSGRVGSSGGSSGEVTWTRIRGACPDCPNGEPNTGPALAGKRVPHQPATGSSDASARSYAELLGQAPAVRARAAAVARRAGRGRDRRADPRRLRPAAALKRRTRPPPPIRCPAPSSRSGQTPAGRRTARAAGALGDGRRVQSDGSRHPSGTAASSASMRPAAARSAGWIHASATATPPAARIASRVPIAQRCSTSAIAAAESFGMASSSDQNSSSAGRCAVAPPRRASRRGRSARRRRRRRPPPRRR